ncbi:hypothetical protein RSAG8_13053, partial [Rhizoctonia solani AG-8 WAC10335]
MPHPHFKKRPADTDNSSQPRPDVEITVGLLSRANRLPLTSTIFPPTMSDPANTPLRLSAPSRPHPHFKKRPADTDNSSQPRPDVEITVNETPVDLYNFPPDDVRSREYASETIRSVADSLSAPSRPQPAPTRPPSIPDSPLRRQTPRNTRTNTRPLRGEGLVQRAKDAFNLNVGDCDTRTIVDLLQLTKADQTPEMGSKGGPPSIVMLPPTPLGTGGGWSQNVVGAKRRGSQVSIPSNDDATGKPQLKVTEGEVENIDSPKSHGKLVPGNKILVEEDTVMEDTPTESETDDDMPSTAVAFCLAISNTFAYS